MIPGDLIEWTYKRNGRRVINREQLWSTLMKRWVPIGSSLVHTLVSIDGEQITWMNEEGLFRARVDDTCGEGQYGEFRRVIPRACG